MAAILLNALFALGGMAALTAIWTSLRRYGRAALALRGAGRACPVTRDVHFRLVEVTATVAPKVLRPDFTVQRAVPPPQSGLRAAA